jgi:DNA repair protein RecO (recombination protein O)
MAAEPALAIVVRGTDWSETSRITTLFTREFGKVRALAKGGRRLKSSFDVAFDLLTVCQVMFIRKQHGGLDLLTEARLEAQFPYLRTNLPALYAGYYVAELLADGTQDYDPHPPLFDAALETLRGLGKPTPQPPPCREGEQDIDEMRMLSARSGSEAPSLQGGGWGVGSWVSAFELVWLQELGYSPRLDACAGCGVERLNPDAAALYSPTAGGVLCPRCGPAVADRWRASGDALACLRRLGERGAAAELPAACRAEVRGLLGHTVSCVLGRRPRLLGYVDAR